MDFSLVHNSFHARISFIPLKKSTPSFVAFFALLPLLFSFESFAQVIEPSYSVRKVIQFSGLVVGGDSLYGLPGTAVMIPSSGRGTITNEFGFFSLPVQVGDSVLFQLLGFKKKFMRIQSIQSDKQTVIVELDQDTILYPEIEIFPFPTEEEFKKAFLAMKPGNDPYWAARKNLNPALLQRMLAQSEMSGSESQAYYLQQQAYRTTSRNLAPAGYIALLNPFAWANFVRSVRRGDLKKYRQQKEQEEE